MTNYALARKLALLPEGLAESNVQSWKETVEFFERPVDAMIGEHFPNTGYLCDIAKAILQSQQAKLFRAGEKAYDLIISTADQRELKIGEPFLHLDADRGFLTVRYDTNEPDTVPYTVKEKSNIHIRIMGSVDDEVMTLSEDNVMTALQPMLNLLWDETRGKKNA